MDSTRPLPQRSAQPGQPGPAGGRRRPGRARRYLKRAAIALVTVVGVLAVAVGALWVMTPSASEATQLAEEQARQDGIPYPGPAAPQSFTRPLIATEDHRFYSEPGVDILAVGRVAWAEITSGNGGDQGGATIEQQLAKLLYTPTETGLGAEAKQVVLAFKLNLAYSKQQILDMYAEAAYYGNGYYGLEAASCGYFGRPASELTVTQGAMLAGVVNAPSIDDPVTDPANARARLEHVIARMVAVGDLTSAQAQQALNTPLGLSAGASPNC